jgi:hypothetical protein
MNGQHAQSNYSKFPGDCSLRPENLHGQNIEISNRDPFSYPLLAVCDLWGPLNDEKTCV